MGRVDIARYANGAKQIENAVCVVQGGVMRRPGTRYAAAAKYGDRGARLIPTFLTAPRRTFWSLATATCGFSRTARSW